MIIRQYRKLGIVLIFNVINAINSGKKNFWSKLRCASTSTPTQSLKSFCVTEYFINIAYSVTVVQK